MIRETHRVIAVLVVLAVGVLGACSGGDDDAPGSDDAGAGSGGSGGSRAGASGAGSGGASGSTGSGTDDAGMSSAGSGGTGSDQEPDTDGGDTSGGGDAGGQDAGLDAGPALEPGCAGLEECCATLDPPAAANCNLIADNGNDATCDAFQPLVCMSGSADDDACPKLDECCETLPLGPIRVTCANTVMSGTDLECQQLTLAFCPEGGDAQSCEDLAARRETRPPPMQAGCTAIVDQGLAANCANVEALLCP